MDDVEKILDLLVWFYGGRWRVAESNRPIPLNLLREDEKTFIIEHSLLNILIN